MHESDFVRGPAMRPKSRKASGNSVGELAAWPLDQAPNASKWIERVASAVPFLMKALVHPDERGLLFFCHEILCLCFLRLGPTGPGFGGGSCFFPENSIKMREIIETTGKRHAGNGLVGLAE